MNPQAKNWRRLLTALCVGGVLLWIALRHPDTPQGDQHLLQRESLMMGTLVSITVYLDDAVPRDRAETALTQVEQFLRQFDEQWAAWGNGELGQLNHSLAAGRHVPIPSSLSPLFVQAARALQLSGGRFDVRIGALIRLWGFDDETHYLKQPPPRQAIEKILASDTLQYDFGAIAKGYAADLAIAQLKQAGISNAIVNLGGNLRVSGQHGARAWSIGIRHPRPDEHTRIVATLKTQADEAVITSGDYERYFEFHGQRYSHILNPKTGEPAQGLQSVTVVYPEGAWADAASTALFVAGPRHWRETAARMGITQVLVVDAQGAVTVTQALAPRLEFAKDIKPVVVP